MDMLEICKEIMYSYLIQTIEQWIGSRQHELQFKIDSRGILRPLSYND